MNPHPAIRVFSAAIAGRRYVSSAATRELLINAPEYSWLKTELDLQETNSGVYNGEWIDTAHGKV